MKKVIENLQKAVQIVRPQSQKVKFIDVPTCSIKRYNRFHGHKSLAIFRKKDRVLESLVLDLK